MVENGTDGIRHDVVHLDVHYDVLNTVELGVLEKPQVSSDAFAHVREDIPAARITHAGGNV